MKELVFLLEEPSAKALLESLLPRFLCSGIHVRYIPFEGKQDQCMVRIACKELEAFYLADLEAVEKGLSMQGLVQHQQQKKFRSPDSLGNPSQELKMLTKGRYQKISGSREIGKHLNLENQRSTSFFHLLKAIKRSCVALQHECTENDGSRSANPAA